MVKQKIVNEDTKILDKTKPIKKKTHKVEGTEMKKGTGMKDEKEERRRVKEELKNETGDVCWVEPSPLIISTLMIIITMKSQDKDKKDGKGKSKEIPPYINLDLFSRFVKIYSDKCDKCNDKEGCSVGINNSNSDISRGVFTGDFDNQATLIYNYWSFRSINVKIFSNCKLQITGTVSCKEAEYVAQHIINQFKTTNIRIYKSIDDVKRTMYVEKYKYNANDDMLKYTEFSKNFNNHYKEKFNTADDDLKSFYMIYNQKTGKPIYYRLNYLDTINNKKICFSYDYTKKDTLKGFVNDSSIKAVLTFLLEEYKKSELEFLQKIAEMNDDDDHDKRLMDKMRRKLNSTKKYIMSMVNTRLMDNKLIELLTKIYKNELDEQVDESGVSKQYNYDKIDSNFNRLIKYVDSGKAYNEFPLKKNNIKFSVDTVKINMINSDFKSNFPIINTRLNYILNKKYKVLALYDPNEYHGIKCYFYWNKKNTEQTGKCTCIPSCKKMTNSIMKCTKITILIPQSGSIIITGAKELQQIKDAYKFINAVLKANFKLICGPKSELDGLNSSILRRIQRKKRLFYLEKKNIKGITFK